jgi:hypothetical protein
MASDPVKICRGVRQGDPMSPLLYALAIEPLAATLRKHLTGISIPNSNRNLKLALYADDLAVYANGQEDLATLEKWLREFETAAGAKVNRSKSEALPFRLPLEERGTLSITWLGPDQTTRYLGVQIGVSPTNRQLWAPAIEKLRTKVTSWARFPLPFRTRALVAKVFLWPALDYVARVTPPGNEAAREIRRTLRCFIWGKPVGRIREEKVFRPLAAGGLGIPDPSLLGTSSHLTWLHHHLSSPPSPAKALSNNMIVDAAPETGFGLSLIGSTFLPTGDSFYHRAQATWARRIRGSPESQDPTWVLSQPLFFNPLLATPPSLALSWALKGVIRVGDIWDDGEWMTKKRLADFNQLKVSQATLNTSIATIPSSWTETLRSSDTTSTEMQDLFPQLLLLDHKPFLPMTPATVKVAARKRSQLQPHQPKDWEETFGPLPWHLLWKRCWHPKAPPAHNQTLYLTLHYALLTGVKAHSRGFPPIPYLCHCGPEEDLTHLVWNCEFARVIWRSLWRSWRLLHPQTPPPPFSLPTILGSHTTRSARNQWETLKRSALHLIWSQRCAEIFGGTPRSIANSDAVASNLFLADGDQ